MDNLLSEGLELMVFGMGFVVVFLTLLVFATSGMSKVVDKFFPEAPPQPKAKKAAPAAVAANNNDELVAVMTAAVHKYRS
ncbi:OadG family transporter subunit [uncultured Neptuniibacter sp.]|uniref:OadG family protein n=1 Tax=uncultured Neptuniibacter sp. TaxID=502143 RepID=UPI0026016941|nr:OadG family transporter subunit [uncultured Neptuniibacter sp.]